MKPRITLIARMANPAERDHGFEKTADEESDSYIASNLVNCNTLNTSLFYSNTCSKNKVLTDCSTDCTDEGNHPGPGLPGGETRRRNGTFVVSFVASFVGNLAMGSPAHEAFVKLAARLDLFVFQGQVPEEEATEGKHLLSRVSATITKPAP